MDKEIILINPFPRTAQGINEATISPPLGLAYICAVLKKKGHNCSIIDANILRLKNDTVLEKIKTYNPKLIGISMNVVTAPSGIELAQLIKKQLPKVKLIVGGPFPSSMPDEVLNSSQADALVYGEGEETVLEVVNKLKAGENPFQGTKGLFYRGKEGSLIQGGPRSRIKSLDTLPFPAYEELPDVSIYKSRSRKFPVGWVFTSRGCPYDCGFCFKKIFGRKVTFHSPERIINEIEFLIKNYGVRQIDILDDNFTANIKRGEAVLDEIIKRNLNIAINLQNGIRTENITHDFIKKMKKAGVYKVGIGVESGDEGILKVMKKELNLEQVLSVSKMARKMGISVSGFFILGYPGETETTLQKTIDFSKKMNPHVANFSLALPFPGTETHDMVEKKGHFLIDIKQGFLTGFTGSKMLFKYGDLEPETVVRYFKKAHRSFFMRPYKVVDLITQIKSLTELMWFVSAIFNLLKASRNNNKI
jgi:radical SAM superfamily enzyme YgiQ (UPF0313 family)